MKIRIKKDRIEFWKDVSMTSKPLHNWKVFYLWYNPIKLFLSILDSLLYDMVFKDGKYRSIKK